jgi:hypothetical protein
VAHPLVPSTKAGLARRAAATCATMAVSGAVHEMIFAYIAPIPPTGKWLAFFLLQVSSALVRLGAQAPGCVPLQGHVTSRAGLIIRGPVCQPALPAVLSHTACPACSAVTVRGLLPCLQYCHIQPALPAVLSHTACPACSTVTVRGLLPWQSIHEQEVPHAT